MIQEIVREIFPWLTRGSSAQFARAYLPEAQTGLSSLRKRKSLLDELVCLRLFGALFFAGVMLTTTSSAALAVTVSASPSTCASVTGIGSVAWTNPIRGTASDNNYATASVDGSTTRFLECTGYGFAIPTGATIDGITVNVERKSSSTSNGGSSDAAMRLVKAGTIGTTDNSTTTSYTTADVIEAHGSATELWGTTWTAADINNTNFGAAFAATKASGAGTAQTISVDWIQIVVDYTIITAPTVTTNTATSVTSTGATLNGTVSSNGASTAVTFDYGLTAGYGNSVTAAESPLAATASGSSVSAVLTGLTCGTTYHFRVKGVNSVGTSNGSDRTFTTVCPAVVSIDTASPNPTGPLNDVVWTVVFNTSVSGVDPSDFTLVTGGMTGASITSVTGSGTTWTVNANTGSGSGTLGLNLVDDDTIVEGSGLKLGGTGTGNGNFTGQVYTIAACSPPSNIPSGVTVTCQCDNFGRTTLNPSTIFGGDWQVSTSDSTGIVPSIVNSGYLRLTNNTGNNAKAATVPGIFPASGNYISVEFKHYAYNGSGADGIAVTLSDYSVPAVPGAYGGSLGYAQKTGINGFAGGWVGIALDEYGNYENSGEGRYGGLSTSTLYPQSVGVRGSGSGSSNSTSNYPWLRGATGLSPGIDNRTSTTPSYGYYYQVIVDARNAGNATPQTFVAVNRDTTGGGSSYSSLVPSFDVFAANPNQAAVPDNWQISFTGSTGGATNIHEISGVRVCAQSIAPTSGASAGSFNAIDEAYGTPSSSNHLPVQNYLTGHIYTKLVGTPFKLDVAALSSSQLVTTYAAGSAQAVSVNLVDNSDGLSNPSKDCTLSCTSICTSKSAVTGGTQTLTFASGASDRGQKQSADFTINSAYQKLVAIISDGTTTACSTDSFSVRPLSIASAISSNATNTGTAGAPVFKAGSDHFSLTATTTGVTGYPSNYSGVLKIDSSAIQPVSPATAAGVVAGTFPAATSGTPSSTATGTMFTYSEVGDFSLPGYPVTNTTSLRGIFDGVDTANECTVPGLTTAQCNTLRAATWTGADSISTKSDCVADSYSNTKDANGKYGCNFGLLTSTGTLGRFVPDHFAVSSMSIVNRSDICPAGVGCPSNFTYMGEQMNAMFTLTAQAAGNSTTKNYIYGAGDPCSLTPSVRDASLVKLCLTTTDNPLGLAVAYAAVSTAPATPGVTMVPVDSTIGFAVGDDVWISKAGTAGAGLSTTVANLTSNSITLSTPIVTAVPAGTHVEHDLAQTRLDTSLQASGSFAAGVANINVPLGITRGANPDGVYTTLDIGMAATDSDSVKMASYDLHTGSAAVDDHALIGSTDIRYGRMKLSNAHGSELLQLPIPVAAQYWNGSGYETNSSDNATILDATTVSSANWTDLTPGNCVKLSATSAWDTACASTGVVPATSSVVLVNGISSFKLLAPGSGKVGSVELTTNAPSYLLTNTLARATFGVYKGSNEFIYLREKY